MHEIFGRILGRQVTIESDGQVDVSTAFETLVQVFTFVATPPEDRGDIGHPFAYQARLDAAKKPVLQLESGEHFELDMALVVEVFGGVRTNGDLTLSVPEGMMLDAAKTLALVLGGDLTVNFQGSAQTLILSPDSEIFLDQGTLNVKNGTLDVSNIDSSGALSGIHNLDINAGFMMSASQLDAISGWIIATDPTSPTTLTVIADSEQDLDPLRNELESKFGSGSQLNVSFDFAAANAAGTSLTIAKSSGSEEEANGFIDALDFLADQGGLDETEQMADGVLPLVSPVAETAALELVGQAPLEVGAEVVA